MSAILPSHLALLDPDQNASYLALCEDVVTIVGVAGFPGAARENGRAVMRAYARALRHPAPRRWRAYHRAVAALLASGTQTAASALDFQSVAACMRLRAFLRENPDLGGLHSLATEPSTRIVPSTHEGDRSRRAGAG
ncbi:MAG: hypothetical protein JWO66_525 [Candidatus Eremiobacteraeota bacterium]|jgi:hypothetical protein|nr:hypothetical protein [Candidatus Eremiobacteraeota bacterium]